MMKFIFALLSGFGTQCQLVHGVSLVRSVAKKQVHGLSYQGSSVEVSSDGHFPTKQSTLSGNSTVSQSQHEAEFDNLPKAYDADTMKNLKLSDEYEKAGEDFLKGAHATLGILFVKSATDLIKYWAKVIQRTNQSTGPDSPAIGDDGLPVGGESVFEQPSKDKLKSIMSEWHEELQKSDSCSDDPFEMQTCIGKTRCLLEAEVGKSINASFFAAFMELQDEVENVILRDFEFHFKEAGGNTSGDVPCPGEVDVIHGANLMEGFEASSERQRKAVAAVVTIHSAAELIERASERRHRGGTATVNDFLDIWLPACTAIGCDHSSFMDICEAMHGHVAELVAVEVPVRVIRVYIGAMRRAMRAQKAWVGQAARHQSEDFRDILEAPSMNAVANKRYDNQHKNVGGMLDGAYMQLKGSNKRLTWWWSCWSVFAGTVIGYGKKFFSDAAVWGAILGVSFSYGLSSTQGQQLFGGGKPCSGRSASLSFGFVIGWVPGIPDAVCFRAGVAVSASFSWSGCTGFDLSITVGASGSIIWGSSACIFGPDLGPFGCARGVTIGVGFICCNFNLRTGGNNCD